MGPKRDIVGAFKKAAEKQDLRFAVSEHLAPSYHWFSTSHTSDQTGPLAGVPYDGADPAYADLYHDLPRDYPYGQRINDRQAPDPWKLHYFKRIKDLVDNYQPDLLYTDGDIFFEEYGLALVANLYKLAPIATAAARGCLHQQAAERLRPGLAFWTGSAAWPTAFRPNPWQTDTCIGDWHYNREVSTRRRRT